MLFLERDAFLAELVRAADDARDGRGVAIALGGEAGIGKTTLRSVRCTTSPMRCASTSAARAIGLGSHLEKQLNAPPPPVKLFF
jgi:hypothetical protein